MLSEIKDCTKSTVLVLRMLEVSENIDRRFPGSRRARLLTACANQIIVRHEPKRKIHDPKCIISWGSPPSDVIS